MVSARSSKNTQAVAMRAKVSGLATRKAVNAAPVAEFTRVTLEHVIFAARNGDLPGTLFLVALADDKTFERISRFALRAFAPLAHRRPEADDDATRLITTTLTNAIVLSRRLRC